MRLTLAACLLALTTPALAQTGPRKPAPAQHGLGALVGAWRMTELRVGTPGDLRPVPYSGQVVFTRSGTMSVQASNPDPNAPDTAYTVNGYEAFYGSVAVDRRSSSFVVTVENALADALVGQELARGFEVHGDTLVLTPADPAEGFRVTYERVSR